MSIAHRLNERARSIVDLFDRAGHAPRARTPAGAFVILAAQLDSPASVTAEAVGISEEDARGLVTGKRWAGPLLLARLGDWVRLRLALLVDELAGEAGAEVEVEAWAVVARWHARPSVHGRWCSGWAPQGDPLAPLCLSGRGAGMPARKLPSSFGNEVDDG